MGNIKNNFFTFDLLRNEVAISKYVDTPEYTILTDPNSTIIKDFSDANVYEEYCTYLQDIYNNKDIDFSDYTDPSFLIYETNDGFIWVVLFDSTTIDFYRYGNNYGKKLAFGTSRKYKYIKTTGEFTYFGPGGTISATPIYILSCSCQISYGIGLNNHTTYNYLYDEGLSGKGSGGWRPVKKIIINGSEPDDIKLNGVTPDKIMLNGQCYFEKAPEPDPHNYLYKWDFTKATDPLVDEVNGLTISTINGIVINQNGMNFNAEKQVAYIGEIDMVGKTIEIDVSNFDFQPIINSGVNAIFLANTARENTGSSFTSLLLLHNEQWKCKEYINEDGSRTSSSNQQISSSIYSAELNKNSFNGKRVKIVCGSDKKTLALYLNNVYIGKIDELYFNDANFLQIGGFKTNPQAAAGCQCYNMTITGVRIYENEE